MYKQPSKVTLLLSALFFIAGLVYIIYDWKSYPVVIALGLLQSVPICLAFLFTFIFVPEKEKHPTLNGYVATFLWLIAIACLAPIGILLGDKIPSKVNGQFDFVAFDLGSGYGPYAASVIAGCTFVAFLALLVVIKKVFKRS